MLSLFVSYIFQDLRLGLCFDSYVLGVEEPPSSTRAIHDLESVIEMDRCVSSVRILNHDPLLDAETHPARECGIFGYMLGVQVLSQGNYGFGMKTAWQETPLLTLQDIRSMEETLRSHEQAQKLHLISVKPLIPTNNEVSDARATINSLHDR